MKNYKEERDKTNTPAKKNTKQWCKGKVGKEHQTQCVKIVRLWHNEFKTERYDLACSCCGKIIECFQPGWAILSSRVPPDWVDESTINIIKV